MDKFDAQGVVDSNVNIPTSDYASTVNTLNTFQGPTAVSQSKNVDIEVDLSDLFNDIYDSTEANASNASNIMPEQTPMPMEYETLDETPAPETLEPKLSDAEYLARFENAPFTLNGQRQNPTLLSPTQAVKYGDIYFVANTFSTYQNKIMYSYDQVNWLTIDPPSDVDFNQPHSVAFDGKNLVITDTENKRMLLYEYKDGEFQPSKSFNDNGLNPRFHYVTYNEETDTYYGVASEFQDSTRLYEFKIKDGEFVSTDGTPLVGREIKDTNGNNYVDALNSTYARSLTVEGDTILMPVHNQLKQSEILIMDKDMNTQRTIKIPDDIGGVTCIKQINGYYVLTSLTDKAGEKVNAMCIAKDLEDFENGTYQKVDPSAYYGGDNPNAAPYFIEQYDDRYWVTVNGGPPVCTIDVDNSGNVSVNDSHVR